MNKVDIIEKLVESGKARDLYELVSGTSTYSIANEENNDEELPLEQVKLFHAVRAHLDFVANFGTSQSKVTKDGKYFMARPEKFSEWLKKGAPDISEDELRNYLEDHPL
jgi:hypothetical protein